VSCILSIYVEPTRVGILPAGAVTDPVEEATESVEDDSETDENNEILEIEKRDFGDVEDIDSDVE
jgi:hypothetical protein